MDIRYYSITAGHILLICADGKANAHYFVDARLVSVTFRLMMILPLSTRERLKRIPFAIPIVRRMRICVSARERSVNRLINAPNSGLLQPSPETLPNRYPLFFQFVAHQLRNYAQPKILSYGCSTGEEVFSLHEYVSHAVIKGVDINPYNILRCQKRLAARPVATISFTSAASPADEPDESYNAIFCMAVTRHGQLEAKRPERCDVVLPFSKFEALATDLARCLRPGGFLIIANSHFNLLDTSVCDQFEVMISKQLTNPQTLLNYGPDNRRNDNSAYADAVYRKRGDNPFGVDRPDFTYMPERPRVQRTLPNILWVGIALFLLLLARCCVKFMPLKFLISLLRFAATSATRSPAPAFVTRLNWALDAAAARLPIRTLCYERGLVSFIVLRIFGYAAHFHYGVAHANNPIKAHAWVTSYDQPITGCEIAADYHEIMQIPAHR